MQHFNSCGAARGVVVVVVVVVAVPKAAAVAGRECVPVFRGTGAETAGLLCWRELPGIYVVVFEAGRVGLAEDIDGVSTVMSGVDALMGVGVVAVAAMLVVVAGAEVAMMVVVAGVGDDVMVVAGRGGVVVATTVE